MFFACSEQEPEAEGEFADHRGDGHDEDEDGFLVVVAELENYLTSCVFSM